MARWMRLANEITFGDELVGEGLGRMYEEESQCCTSHCNHGAMTKLRLLGAVIPSDAERSTLLFNSRDLLFSGGGR